MKLSIRKLHTYFYMFCVLLLYLFFYPFFYYFSRKESRYPTLNKLRRLWAKLSSGISGIFYSFEYEVPVDWKKTYIICPNHTSNLDVSWVTILTKNNFSFMGKEELLQNPTTRLFFKTIDIPVKRDSNMAAFRAFKRVSKYLKNGITMIIFPEGKIADIYPPQLQEFKNGPFRLAIEQQTAIIPVTSFNTWKILWDDGLKYGSRTGICNIYIHKPIETVGLKLTDADALRDKVFRIINQKLKEYEDRHEYSR
ncbi:lysophospholipid acyltransferase family protein [Mucilaginibacter arboris]|uniref:1-acyl-sn-glycerol-3-phosphate acyltransferase n=1 Tax=Mucilaginibacter arboris TaxID=2682090 RepID=A0A7K1SW55_9SPHI|nr:lysophospholipid acyltransferase family protein [Mucilaginibacter arboris]MVN21468.1 1-acyl-sn-glycerol-3-phosphate acyltransferase [Mucilaginibacter arboris]